MTNSPTSLLDFIRRRVGVGELVRRRVDWLPADMHWPDKRRQAVINNPHIMDWFFTLRLESFIKHWLYKTLDVKWHWYRFEYKLEEAFIAMALLN